MATFLAKKTLILQGETKRAEKRVQILFPFMKEKKMQSIWRHFFRDVEE